MATLTAPGVYVEEQASGVRPIEAAGTSTAAFFGEAERGPIGSVVKTFNITDYYTTFGGFLDGGRYLAHAVYQFFNNGGSACYVGRVAGSGSATANVTILDRAGTPQDSLTIAASSPGSWGDEIMVVVDGTISTDPDNQFNLSVLRENPVAGQPPVLLEAHVDLSMDPDEPQFVETVVNGASSYLRVDANAANTNFVNGFSESGEIDVDGNPLLTAQQRIIRININNDGLRVLDLTSALSAANLADPSAIASGIQTAIQALTPLKASTDPNAYSAATVAFAVTTTPDGRITITAGGAASAASSVIVADSTVIATNAAGALLLGRNHGGREVGGTANQRPADTPAGDLYLVGDDTVAGSVSAVTPGADGATPQDGDFVAALPLLDPVRDVSLLAIPGVGSEPVIDAAMNYCSNRQLSDCFYIGDVASTDDSYVEAIAVRDALNAPNSYGAVYFPWLYMLDPSGRSSEPVLAPPSGFMAGLYGRIDGRRGFWKAPAGSEAIVAGAVGLATDITDVQHGDLNRHPKSISVIRRFPTTGIVAWGARTVSSDPEYKYIPVRRTAIFLRVSIYNGIQWAVFEPNDEPLWASLRLNIGAFMNTLYRRGAFQGSTAKEAYFVKCDSETTTQADIDVGIVNVLVGFAPLKPAEFVVVKIRQIAGQAP
jgi:hypothetical protein